MFSITINSLIPGGSNPGSSKIYGLDRRKRDVTKRRLRAFWSSFRVLIIASHIFCIVFYSHFLAIISYNIDVKRLLIESK